MDLKRDTAKRILLAIGYMDVTWASLWAGAGNLAFFWVKWLRPAMKDTLRVQRLRAVRFDV